MMKIKPPSIFVISVIVVIIINAVIFLSFMRSFSAAHQARFNVDILGRFLKMHYRDNGAFPQSLSELPPINIVSFEESLVFNSSDIASGEWRGYRYAYTRPEKNRFVLSASPTGFFAVKNEFGMTEAGILRMNTRNVDAEADTHAEVGSWSPMWESQGAVTQPDSAG